MMCQVKIMLVKVYKCKSNKSSKLEIRNKIQNRNKLTSLTKNQIAHKKVNHILRKHNGSKLNL